MSSDLGFRHSDLSRPPQRRSRLLAAAVAAALSVGLCACTSVAPSRPDVRLEVSASVVDALKRYEVAYRLQPGDVLEVFIYRHQELSRKVVVRPDGLIALPLLGEVMAAGLSPTEFAAELNKQYSRRLKDPEVTVMVENPPEPQVYVVGMVGAPRAVPLRQARTLAQALAVSGDATRAASPNSVALVRLNAQGQMELLQAQARGAGGDAGALSQPEIYMAMNTLLLKPNDLIVVPESLRAQLVRGVTDFNTFLTPIFNAVILREIVR